jgi:hypothetical protein
MSKGHTLVQKNYYPGQQLLMLLCPPSKKKRSTSPDKATLSNLFTYLNSFHAISIASTKYIEKHIVVRNLKKGDLLQKSDAVCPYIYFVAEGVMRGYIVGYS